MGIIMVMYAGCAIVFIAFYFIKYCLSYWKRQGVPHEEPNLIFGNMKAFSERKHLSVVIREHYEKFKGKAPFFGFYLLIRPTAIITDLDLVKQILIKDFNNFVDRGAFHNEEDDPLTGHLFALDGQRWRQLRVKLSPTFTSGKMKFMFPTILDVGHRFADVFAEMAEKNSLIEIKDVLARFTTDVIGTCAFGIECNSLKDPNAEFRRAGQMFFSEHRHNMIVTTFIRTFPDLARKLRFRVVPDYVHDFFMGAVRETVEYREKNNIVKNDFMNMLIELKNSKQIKTEDGEIITGLTMNELAAQAFVFFLAGFETSSTTMGFALYELALNQDIQERLRDEINEVWKKYNGVLSYESMQDMRYMDQVIYETLRKYAIVFILNRKAKEDYKVPGTNYTIEKGITVFIPADAIHHDPEIYPDPETFDPDRFSPEEIQKRNSVTWLPFGDGPRNCIGLRFGKIQTRLGLFLLLKNFRFFPTDKLKVPVEFDKKSFILSSKGGINLRVEKV